MSDEFLKVATREINEDLDSIMRILDACSDYSDMAKNSATLESHMHKIKGLAPMMGKEDVGNLAKTLDSILKKIVSGHKVEGFLDSLLVSTKQMKKAMERNHDLGPLQKEISDIAAKIPV